MDDEPHGGDTTTVQEITQVITSTDEYAATPTRRRVGAGPFEIEPVELGLVLSENFSDEIDGAEIHRRCHSWLVNHLSEAGVALGSADREIVEVLALEGWSVAQIVAGWVTRAHERAAT